MKYIVHTTFGPLPVEASNDWEALTILNRADAVVVEQQPDGQFEASRYLPREDAFVSYRAASQTLALNKAFRHARQCEEVAND